MALYEPSPMEVAATMNKRQAHQNIVADITQQFNELAAQGQMGAGTQPLPMPGQPVQQMQAPPAPPPPSQPQYQPAVTPPAPPQTPQAPPAMQEPVDQTSGLIHGKYKTMPDADKGYFNLLNYATAAVDRARALEAQLAQVQAPSAYPTHYGPPQPLVPGSPPGTAPRVNPVERYPAAPVVDWSQSGTVKQVASSMGLEDSAPLAQFANEIAIQAAAAARQAAQAEFAPIKAQQDAESAMRQQHPDAFNYVGEMQVFLQSDPTVAQEFNQLLQQGQPLSAMKYVWAEFRANAYTQAQNNLQTQAADATLQRNAAMAHAGMSPSQPGTPVQAADPRITGSNPEVVAELAKQKLAGNYQAGQAFTAATFGEMLKNDPLYEATFGPRR